MEIILVKSDLMNNSGVVTVLVHPDDYECLKANFENISNVFTEPLIVSPPVGEVTAPKKNCTCSICGEKFESHDELYAHFDNKH